MSIKVPRRSLITGSAALGALATMRESAEADIKFTQFPFTATGAPTARTQPDRLAGNQERTGLRGRSHIRE